jgi:hypothetical protein
MDDVKILKLLPLKRVAVLLGCVVLVVSAMVGSVAVSAAPASADTCKEHVFYVTTSDDRPRIWSVYGDLYAGDGRHVYHWQEEGKRGTDGDYVRWTFNYCGDGGWAHIWISPNPDGSTASFLGLDLNYSYHWCIEGWQTVYQCGKG